MPLPAVRTCAVAVVLLCCAAVGRAGQPTVLDSGLAPAQVESRRYLDYARECIDLLMARGTDRYGKTHSPVLVSILDVRTRVEIRIFIRQAHAP